MEYEPFIDERNSFHDAERPTPKASFNDARLAADVLRKVEDWRPGPCVAHASPQIP